MLTPRFWIGLVSLALLAGAANVARAAEKGEKGEIGEKNDKDRKESKEGKVGGEWQRSFDVKKEDLASTGRNPYFVLEPGHVLRFAHGKETLTITVTNETKVVDGVETRVVEEREEADGKLVEVSKNYFAVDKRTRAVYYFGEDVDEYKGGKVSHGGSWLAGEKGAKFGLMVPGEPKAGERFYQELAPKVALDRCEVVAVDATIETPAGKFEKCVRMKESSELEEGTSEKAYAPGVGLVKDDEFELVKVEPAKAAKAAK